MIVEEIEICLKCGRNMDDCIELKICEGCPP